MNKLLRRLRMIRNYLLVLFVIIIDQWTKWLIVTKMDLHESVPIIDNFFYITSHRNEGAAWGILQGQMIFFYIITVIVVIGLVYLLHKYAHESKFMAVALSLFLAGAIGNFIDRLIRQAVVDFLDVYIFTYNYPIFNIADSALVIGAIMTIIAMYLDEKNKNGRKTT